MGRRQARCSRRRRRTGSGLREHPVGHRRQRRPDVARTVSKNRRPPCGGRLARRRTACLGRHCQTAPCQAQFTPPDRLDQVAIAGSGLTLTGTPRRRAPAIFILPAPDSLSPSWPGLSRPSAPQRRCVDGRDRPGHDGEATSSGQNENCWSRPGQLVAVRIEPAIFHTRRPNDRLSGRSPLVMPAPGSGRRPARGQAPAGIHDCACCTKARRGYRPEPVLGRACGPTRGPA